MKEKIENFVKSEFIFYELNTMKPVWAK